MTTQRGDIALLTGVMKLFGWLNLGQGVLNVALYYWVPMAPLSLVLTGLLSATTCLLVRLKIRFMMHTKDWMELGLTAICGLYIPIIVLVFSVGQLVMML